MGRWNLASLMAVAVSKRPSPTKPRLRKKRTNEGGTRRCRTHHEGDARRARAVGAREAVDHDVVAAGERVRDPRVAAVLEELEDAVGRVHAVVLPPVGHGEAAVVEARVALEEVG